MSKMATVFAVVLLSGLCGTRLAADEHAAVGSEKCAKTCHKVQLASWSQTAHATAKVRTECETCHGNGADYMKLKVMKDPAAAQSAGLIAKPTRASCTLQCHVGDTFTDEAVSAVHAHKPKK